MCKVLEGQRVGGSWGASADSGSMKAKEVRVQLGGSGNKDRWWEQEGGVGGGMLPKRQCCLAPHELCCPGNTMLRG